MLATREPLFAQETLQKRSGICLGSRMHTHLVVAGTTQDEWEYTLQDGIWSSVYMLYLRILLMVFGASSFDLHPEIR